MAGAPAPSVPRAHGSTGRGAHGLTSLHRQRSMVSDFHPRVGALPIGPTCRTIGWWRRATIRTSRGAHLRSRRLSLSVSGAFPGRRGTLEGEFRRRLRRPGALVRCDRRGGDEGRGSARGRGDAMRNTDRGVIGEDERGDHSCEAIRSANGGGVPKSDEGGVRSDHQRQFLVPLRFANAGRALRGARARIPPPRGDPSFGRDAARLDLSVRRMPEGDGGFGGHRAHHK